jgi:S1-C subfamily serine protease
LEASANHLGQNVLKSLRLWRHEYDDVTVHGKTLGAVFPAVENAAPSAKSVAPGATKNLPVTAANAPPPKAKAAAKGSTGSGFFITKDGHVLTNAHVVGSCTNLVVRTAQGTTAPASILSRSEHDDLAILKADVKTDHVAAIRANPSPRAGEAIVVYGFPLSGLLSSSGNATTGGISALAGLRNDSRHLQISAPVQPGNSGGPLVDMSGNVVGVVFSKLDALRVARATEDIPQNINFAIKSSVAANFLDAGGLPMRAASPARSCRCRMSSSARSRSRSRCGARSSRSHTRHARHASLTSPALLTCRGRTNDVAAIQSHPRRTACSSIIGPIASSPA